jgi:hypothetical protein
MCLLCPDSPLINASRQAGELVGEELVQAELAELLTLFEAPPELLEELLELPVLEALMATVAELGLPKPAAPAMEVNTTLKLLPAAAALTGTEIDFAEVSPSAQVTVPLVAEKSAPAVAVPFTVV